MKYVNDKSKIKLHYALRGKYNSDLSQNYCNLLEDKIGIDHLGNVYSCAWAGNIGNLNECNPFYLGNVLENDLVNILFKNQKVEKLMTKINNPEKHCRLFSYLNSSPKPELSMFSQNAPLHMYK